MPGCKMKVDPAVRAASSRELYAFKQKCAFHPFGFVVLPQHQQRQKCPLAGPHWFIMNL